eukprot:PhM_4_TR7532/c0_g1_i1/m.28190/K06287/maf; septum formation protein
MQNHRIILGSSSKFRRAVLEKHLGADYTVECLPPNIDEKAIRDPDAETLVRLISLAKADAVKAQLSDAQKGSIIVCGDQVTRFNGTIREKPVSREQNVEFLKSYRNSYLETVTGLCVENTAEARREFAVQIDRVCYGDIPDDVIGRVIDKGDTMHTCGGFVVEDPELRACMTELRGTEDGVMGMPVALLESLIAKVTS